MNSTELFHGSHASRDLSRGLFCSVDKNVALSHGPVLTHILVSDDKMLSNYTLNYEIDQLDEINAVLARECGEGADIERAWEIVVDSAGCEGAEDELEMFRADNAAEAGWEAQRIRGEVCRALGYHAIEMEDEHGTSWLVVDGEVVA